METDLFNQDKILVCAPSNAAANNLADRLSKLPILKNKMARYFPTKRQDLFNLDKKQIHPHSVMQMIIDHLDQIYEGPNRFGRSIEDHVYYIGSSKQANDLVIVTKLLINHIKQTYRNGEDTAHAQELR